jgi:hypothetical protein
MDVMVIRSHPCDTMDAKGWKGVCQQSSIIQIGMDLFKMGSTFPLKLRLTATSWPHHGTRWIAVDG